MKFAVFEWTPVVARVVSLHITMNRPQEPVNNSTTVDVVEMPTDSTLKINVKISVFEDKNKDTDMDILFLSESDWLEPEEFTTFLNILFLLATVLVKIPKTLVRATNS